MIDVLYVGAANLAKPTSGTDICSLWTLQELSEDPQLTVSAVSVAPSPFDGTAPADRLATLFLADTAAPASSFRRALQKLELLVRGGILFQTGFKSNAARAEIRSRLAKAPDVLLIDHITAAANISLSQLLACRLRKRTKTVVIAHDVSSELLRDRARMNPSKLRAFAIHLHAFHSQLYENVVFALAHRVIFLSQHDRAKFGFIDAAKSVAMCQIIETTPIVGGVDDEALGPYLVFVGSPSFFPNAFAMDWIMRRLAPYLQARMPQMRILLVGKGTDRSDDGRPDNVLGLGFVDDDRLNRLLHGSSGALSPVIHGSGIKIKVLQAIAAGCAIFATESSLRGYEFMRLDPILDIEDPSGSANRIAAIVAEPSKLAEYRQRSETRWKEFKRDRRGKLAQLLKSVAPVPSDTMSQHASTPLAR